MDAVKLRSEYASPLTRAVLFSQQKEKVAPAGRKEDASARSEFPDPRLFDYDKNGTVDANDVIQERTAREESKAKPAESVETVTPHLSLFA